MDITLEPNAISDPFNYSTDFDQFVASSWNISHSIIHVGGNDRVEIDTALVQNVCTHLILWILLESPQLFSHTRRYNSQLRPLAVWFVLSLTFHLFSTTGVFGGLQRTGKLANANIRENCFSLWRASPSKLKKFLSEDSMSGLVTQILGNSAILHMVPSNVVLFPTLILPRSVRVLFEPFLYPIPVVRSMRRYPRFCIICGENIFCFSDLKAH